MTEGDASPFMMGVEKSTGEVVSAQEREVLRYQVAPTFSDEPVRTHTGYWTPVGWQKTRHLTVEMYENMLNVLRSRRNDMERNLSTVLWWIGDIMIAGERDLGEEFFQIVDAAGYTKESLIKIRRTCEEFPKDHRYLPMKVSFWTHWDVRKLSYESRNLLLTRYAQDPDYSRDDLRAEAKVLLDAEEAQDEIPEGAGVATDSSGDDLPACPLCSGAGHVTHEERDAFLADGAAI